MQLVCNAIFLSSVSLHQLPISSVERWPGARPILYISCFFIFYPIILFVPLFPPRLCSSVPHAFIDLPVPSSFHTFFSALISLIYSHFFPAFLHHQRWTVVLMKLGNATGTFSSALWTTRTTPYSAGQLGTVNRISQPKRNSV